MEATTMRPSHFIPRTPGVYIYIYIYSQNHSFVTRLFYKFTSILHIEAIDSFEIFVFSCQTARYRNSVDHNILYKGTSGQQKQQRSEVIYLKNVTSVFFDLSSGLLVLATLPSYLFLDSCVHYLITLSLFHTSNRPITRPTNEQGIRKNIGVIVLFMDGLRNTTIHDSADSCSRFEPESYQVSGSGHC
jgi:hypothetical protein